MNYVASIIFGVVVLVATVSHAEDQPVIANTNGNYIVHQEETDSQRRIRLASTYSDSLEQSVKDIESRIALLEKKYDKKVLRGTEVQPVILTNEVLKVEDIELKWYSKPTREEMLQGIKDRTKQRLRARHNAMKSRSYNKKD